jgi:uncharacterized membrane-anchored protein
MTRLLTMLVALLLPLAGVLGMIVKSELTLARGRELRVPIRGFDPRDMLRGQYLTFQFDWDERGSCPNREDCCYCVIPQPGPRGVLAQKGECEEAVDCMARIDESQLAELRRFYIPEEVGLQLEELVRKKRAVVVLAVTPEGRVALKDLEIDGRPWREALKK